MSTSDNEVTSTTPEPIVGSGANAGLSPRQHLQLFDRLQQVIERMLTERKELKSIVSLLLHYRHVIQHLSEKEDWFSSLDDTIKADLGQIDQIFRRLSKHATMIGSMVSLGDGITVGGYNKYDSCATSTTIGPDQSELDLLALVSGLSAFLGKFELLTTPSGSTSSLNSVANSVVSDDENK